MSYRDALDYLESKTKVLELCNDFGARLVVCPEWNGRVMTSTADGIDGDSYGRLNISQIDGLCRGDLEKTHGNRFNVGGEDQPFVSPEGGPFNLYYEYDTEASAIHDTRIEAPVGYTEGTYQVDFVPKELGVRLRRNIKMQNLAGAKFDVDFIRTIRLNNDNDLKRLFDVSILLALEQQDISYISFTTANTLVNHGAKFSRNSGLLSLHIRSMYNSTSNHVLVVPYKIGDDAIYGPCYSINHFDTMPHGRLRDIPGALLFRVDGRFRCQVGVSRLRAVPQLAAIDFLNGVLTIVSFNLPDNPDAFDYLCNDYCEMNGEAGDEGVYDFVATRERYLNDNSDNNPYSGEVVRAYGNGKYENNEVREAYYEFDTFSPAKELAKHESITHIQTTTHIQADRTTLIFLLRTLFNVELDAVYQKMLT